MPEHEGGLHLSCPAFSKVDVTTTENKRYPPRQKSSYPCPHHRENNNDTIADDKILILSFRESGNNVSRLGKSGMESLTEY